MVTIYLFSYNTPMLNKIIFTLSVLMLGWFLHDSLDAIKIPKEIQKITFLKMDDFKPKKNTIKESNNTLITTDKKSNSTEMLTQNNNFYDLLSFYLDASQEKEEVYLQKIENYLERLIVSNPSKALEFLVVLLEEAPQSRALELLIKAHIQEKNFPDAIEYLKQEKEEYLSYEKELEIMALIDVLAKEYINTKKAPSFKKIAFIEEMIDFNPNEPFYTFALAKELYPNNKTVALELFDTISQDDNYSKQIRKYLHPNQKYDYAVFLTKYGVHYVANIYLDGVLFRLMLDTGASYILLDEDKGAFLPPIANIKLHTASNTIDGQIAEVNRLQVGEVSLFNIKVTLAPFKRDKIDGLLGMNFFNKFDFHIDQNKNILYLNNK